MTDRRYHVKFQDEDSGEELGLILLETPQIGLQRRLINPYAAKTGQGDTEYSDLTEWTVAAQDDWRGGRGQDQFEEDTAFYDAIGLETRIEGQVTLGPYPHAPAADVPQVEESASGTKYFGYPGAEACVDTEASAWITPGVKFGQIVDEQWDSLPSGQDAHRLVSVDLYIKKEAALPDGTTITLSLAGGDGSFPGAVIATKTITGADVGVDGAWVTFTFNPIVDMDDYDWFWMVLEHDDPTHYLYWYYGMGSDSYSRGRPAYKASGSGWCHAHQDDFLFKVHWAEVKLAQQFTTVGGFDLDSVSVWGWCWFKPIRVSLYSDDGDAPDTKLKECVIGAFNQKRVAASSTDTTIDLAHGTTDDMAAGMWVEINGETRMVDSITDSDTFVLTSALSAAPDEGDFVYAAYHQPPWANGWKKARFDGAETLAAATKYWIVVEQLAEGTTLFNGWSGLGYTTTAYADGIAARKLGGGAWAEVANIDFLFRLNDFGLDDTVIAFARYDDDLYCAAGDTVYKWDEAAGDWDVSEAVAGDTVTDLVVWGGYLWAARGDDANLRKYNGAWADGGVKRTLLINFMGGLYASGSGANAHKLYYTDDGAAWSDFNTVGSGDYDILSLAVYRDQLFAATATRLWNCSLDYGSYPALDWAAQEDENNGVGMVAWNKTNCLYIPLRYGLYRWNGDSMVAVGPEQGTGLPEDRAGHIVDLCPTNNWLYAAIDAGEGNVSTVMCYNGLGGWHEIARNEDARKRIKALFYSTLQEPDRLWYGLGDETRYCHVPDRSDNPFQWRGHAFNPSGELITSWFGSDLLEVVKDLHEVVLYGEDIDSTHNIDVYVQVDRNKDEAGNPLWAHWGTADESPRVSLTWDNAPSWRTKELKAGCTKTSLVLDDAYDATGMAPGDFVEINGEISQVQSASGSAVTLASALSTAPSAGDWMYAARPAGREFRLLLALHSDEDGEFALTTPKIEAVLIRYQNNVLDRFLWTVKVNVGGKSADLGGAAYPMSAASLRVQLDRWAKRKTPFNLVDLDGRSHTVKVTSAGEGGYTREEKAGGEKAYDSTYNFNLVEVE